MAMTPEEFPLRVRLNNTHGVGGGGGGGSPGITVFNLKAEDLCDLYSQRTLYMRTDMPAFRKHPHAG